MSFSKRGEVEFNQVQRSTTPGLHPHRLQDVGVSLREHFHMHVMLRFEIGDERGVARGFIGENRQRDVELIRLRRGVASRNEHREHEGERSRRCPQ